MKYFTNRQNLTKTSMIVLAAIAPAIVTACGMTSTAQKGQTIPPPPEGQTSVLVDDLEDGDRFNEFQGTWFTYDDRNQGGDSQVIPEGYSAFKASPGGPDGSSLAASITGKVTYHLIWLFRSWEHPQLPVPPSSGGYQPTAPPTLIWATRRGLSNETIARHRRLRRLRLKLAPHSRVDCDMSSPSTNSTGRLGIKRKPGQCFKAGN